MAFPNTYTDWPNGVTSFGIPILGGGGQQRLFGKHRFIDSANGSNANDGTGPDTAWETLTYAFAQAASYETFHLAGGGYTGNFTTPANAEASFVSVIGFPAHPNGLATYVAPSNHSSPIIDLKARGWSFSYIEFDCPTNAAAINMNKSQDGSTDRPDFMTVENCIFTTGKYGIMVDGGNTYATIRNCRFDQMTTTGAHAIIVDNTDFHLPQHWLVENNQFMTNVNHIGPSGAGKGWMNSTFRGNVFLKEGIGQNTTTILDIRDAGGGGNMVVDNYFDLAKGGFTGSTTVRGNTSDVAAGNHFIDGVQTEVMNLT